MPRYHFHFASRGGEQVPDLMVWNLTISGRHTVTP